MAPSLTAEALNSAVRNEELVQRPSPPSSCGSNEDQQGEQEHLGVADTVLNDANWSWLCDLLDPVRDAAVRRQAKGFFARLLKSQDAAGVDATLAEMESWRQELGDERERSREHELARALFLLGYDKSMSLAR